MISFFTPPRNRGGVIFSLQFVYVCVCLSVCPALLVNKFQPNGWTDLDAIFAKWLLPALTWTLLNLVTLHSQRSRSRWCNTQFFFIILCYFPYLASQLFYVWSKWNSVCHLDIPLVEDFIWVVNHWLVNIILDNNPLQEKIELMKVHRLGSLNVPYWVVPWYQVWSVYMKKPPRYDQFFGFLPIFLKIWLWPWPWVKVIGTLVNKCILLGCTLVLSMKSVGETASEIWPVL